MKRTRQPNPLEAGARAWLREATATLKRTEARCAATVSTSTLRVRASSQASWPR